MDNKFMKHTFRPAILMTAATALWAMTLSPTAHAREAALSVSPTVSASETQAKTLPEGKSTLTIRVTNVQPDNANLVINLYENEADYVAFIPSASQKITAKDAFADVTFNNIPNGYYAYRVLHDRDGNGKLSSVDGVLEPYIHQGLNRSERDAETWDAAKFLLPRGQMIRTSSFEVEETNETQTAQIDETVGAQVINFIREF